MKKILAAALSAAFVLSFAAISSAAHEEKTADASPVVAKGTTAVTIDGSMRFRGYTQGDTTEGDSASDIAGYDTRVQLGIGAKVADNVSAYLQLETGDNTSDVDTWGEDTSELDADKLTPKSLHNGGSKHADGANDLSIMQAWINYKTDWGGVKIGHLPLALGNKLFFDHTGSGDDAIVVYFDPNSQTHIGLLDVKFVEGSNAQSGDDLDGYVALATYKMEGLNVGANITNLRNNDSEMDFYNIGLTADGKAAGISYKADLEIQTGDMSATQSQSAMALMLGGSMDLGGTVVGAELGYGSGDDGTDASENAAFANFLTDTRYFTTITGYRLAVPGMGGIKNTGLSNMTYLQVNASTKTKCPLTGKDLAVTGRATYMKLNEVAAGAEDALGTEIDAWATWSLAKNTSYTVEAAYLLAGDAWGTSPENAYWLRHGINVSF